MLVYRCFSTILCCECNEERFTAGVSTIFSASVVCERSVNIVFGAKYFRAKCYTFAPVVPQVPGHFSTARVESAPMDFRVGGQWGLGRHNSKQPCSVVDNQYYDAACKTAHAP